MAKTMWRRRLVNGDQPNHITPPVACLNSRIQPTNPAMKEVLPATAGHGTVTGPVAPTPLVVDFDSVDVGLLSVAPPAGPPAKHPLTGLTPGNHHRNYCTFV